MKRATEGVRDGNKMKTSSIPNLLERAKLHIRAAVHLVCVGVEWGC